MSHLCLGGCCLLAGSFCRVRHSGEGAPIACLRLSPFTECFCCQVSGWQVLQCADEPQDFGLICTLQTALCGGGSGCCLWIGGALEPLSSSLWRDVGNGDAYWASCYLPFSFRWYSSTYISQPSLAPTPSYNTSLPCGGGAWLGLGQGASAPIRHGHGGWG